MGDVALSLPVIKSIAVETRLLVLTKPLFAEFFRNINNVSVICADTNGKHKGLPGIIKLCKEIKKEYEIECLIDLHDVIRSRLISFYFRLGGTKIYRINKGRKEKKHFLDHKNIRPLKHTTERYIETFKEAGFNKAGLTIPSIEFNDFEIEEAGKFLKESKILGDVKMLAFAPNARHATKQWPKAYAAELIRLLCAEKHNRVFLFGSAQERDALLELAGSNPSVTVVAGNMSFRIELALLSQMNLMISMDSSNMHLAAIAGLKTVSIWGGTHSYIGFGPIGKQEHLIIETSVSELDCRPCTIFGKGDCSRTDQKFKCLYSITPKMVFDRISQSEL